MEIYKWLTFLLPPLTSIVTWFASCRTRNISTLHEMQKSIDMLVKKNAELYTLITANNERISALTRENADLILKQTKYELQIAKLKREIASLNKKIKN